MNEHRRERVNRWIVELAAIQAEAEAMREALEAEGGTLLAGLEADALEDAGMAVGEAIERLKEVAPRD